MAALTRENIVSLDAIPEAISGMEDDGSLNAGA